MSYLGKGIEVVAGIFVFAGSVYADCGYPARHNDVVYLFFYRRRENFHGRATSFYVCSSISAFLLNRSRKMEYRQNHNGRYKESTEAQVKLHSI